MTTIALPPNFTDAAAIQIGPADHTISVHMNSKRIEQYHCSHADEPYRLVP